MKLHNLASIGYSLLAFKLRPSLHRLIDVQTREIKIMIHDPPTVSLLS